MAGLEDDIDIDPIMEQKIDSYASRWNERWSDLPPPNDPVFQYGESIGETAFISTVSKAHAPLGQKLGVAPGKHGHFHKAAQKVRYSINMMPNARKNSRYGTSSSSNSNELLTPIKTASPYVQMQALLNIERDPYEPGSPEPEPDPLLDELAEEDELAFTSGDSILPRLKQASPSFSPGLKSPSTPPSACPPFPAIRWTSFGTHDTVEPMQLSVQDTERTLSGGDSLDAIDAEVEKGITDGIDDPPVGFRKKGRKDWLNRQDSAGMPGLLTWRVGKSFEGKDLSPPDGFPHRTTLGYEEACASLHTTPSTRVCEGLKKADCSLKHCHLGRKGGEAFARCLKHNSMIRRLDLTSCGLDQTSLEHIVEALANNRHITFLNLSDNRLGTKGAETLGLLLEPKKGQAKGKDAWEDRLPLMILGLNRCSLGNGGVAKICSWLSRNELLTELHLTGNHLRDTGMPAIAELLQANYTLRVLDIGWNSIKEAGATSLKDTLSHNTTLHTLRMAWNGLDDAGGTAMGAMLYSNQGLTRLDLSNCRLGPDAAMVIGEGLKHNNTLQVLVLNENPLGDDGGRHLMNGLTTNTTLRTLGLQGCSFTPTAGKGAARFDARNPNGFYKLNLDNPVDHTIAMQLVNLGKNSPSSWQNARLDSKVLGAKYPAHLNWHMPGQLPHVGRLELEFITTLGPPRHAEVIEREDLDNLIQQLSTRRISDMERLSLLRMFSASHYFTSKQASHLLGQFGLRCEERVKAAVLMFARVVDSDKVEEMFNESWTEREKNKFLDTLGFVRYFQSKNPTGHYELNLAVQIDRLIMHKLVEAAHLEGQQYMNLRNIVYMGKFYNGWKSDADVAWGRDMPDSGYLRCDYITNSYVDASVAPTTDEDLDLLIKEKLSEPIPSDERIVNLRVASVQLAVTCEQAIRLTTLWDKSDERCEVVVICYARLRDRANLWRILLTMNGLEQQCLSWRLGYEVCFNAKHPSMHYCLDLKDPQHAAIAKQLVTWASQIKDQTSIYNMLIAGRHTRGQLVEDASLWSVLTNNSVTGPTPILEFDYAHPNFFEDYGINCPANKQAMNEKLAALHRRKLLLRCCMYHPYWIEMSQWVSIPDSLETPRGDGDHDDEVEKAKKKDPTAGFRNPEVITGSPLDRALNMTGARVLRPHHWQMGWDRGMRLAARTEKAWLEKDAGTPLKTLFWDRLDKDGSSNIQMDEFVQESQKVMGLTEGDSNKLAVMFRAMDRDNDNTVSWIEFEDAVLRGAL